MTLTNAKNAPDGTFSYVASEDGLTYFCTITAATNAYVGFCGNKSKGYITNISVYKPNKAVVLTSYSVKYVDMDGNPLKDNVSYDAVAGNTVTLGDADKANITVGETTYVYDSDDIAETTVAEDGSTIVTVKFHAAANFAYTVNEVCGEAIARTTTGTSYETANVKLGYRRYNVVDGQLYKKDATSKEYNYSFKLTQDNQVESIAYEIVEGTNNVVFCAEGEDIQGLTACNSVNTGIRSSNSSSAYAPADTKITTLAAGKYKIHAIIYDCAKEPNSDWVFMAGAIQAASFNCTAVNIQEFDSEEFAVGSETDLIMLKAGADTKGLDAIYIIKTGDVTADEAAILNAKDALQSEINAAKALDKTGKEGVDALNNAIAAAEEALTTSGATAGQLDAAKTTLAAAVAAFIKGTPILTLTATTGEEVSLTFGVWDTEDTYYVDFGNGELQSAKVGVNNAGPVKEDGNTGSATVFTGTVAGDGTIKVFGNNDIWYFISSGAVPTAFDQAKLMNVVQMSITGANVESVALPAYPKMEQFSFNNSPVKTVDVSNVASLKNLSVIYSSQYTGEMNLETIDLQNNTQLTDLSIQSQKTGVNAKLKEIDLSKNTKLANIYLPSNSLTSVILPEAFTKPDDNDPSVLAKVMMFLNGNKLTTIEGLDKLPAKSQVNISNNLFTLATLPVKPANVSASKYTYAPQPAYVVDETVSELDLSSQLTATGVLTEPATTTFSFVTAGGTALEEGTDYEVTAPGKFKFLKEQTEKVHGVMATTAFPKFTGTNAYVTTEFTVAVGAAEEDPDLVEIPQAQQDQEAGVVTLATVEKDEATGITTYTSKDNVSVIFKMLNVDVKDCDYILFKFAEPVPGGLSYAFWNGEANRGLDAGVTEYKYVFANDNECAINEDGIIPQVSLLTIFTGAGKVVKVVGVYKHKIAQEEEPVEPIYIETDLTAQFTALTDWTKWVGATGYTDPKYCPEVEINGGTKKQVCEKYEGTCASTGDVFYQTVTGLTAGTYKIELYGGAAFTYGRGFGSMAFTGEINTGDAWGTHSSETYTDGQHIDENTGVTLYAVTSEGTVEKEIPIYYAGNFPNGAAVVSLEGVKVGENGELKIGLNKTSQSTNWHVIQLKGVTAQVNAIELHNATLAAAKAALAAEENAVVTGEEKTALQTAINANTTVAEKTADAYQAAINALNNATTVFTGAKAAYQSLADAKANVATYSFKYATAEKKAAAQATLTAEATSAADATAKAEAIAKAFRAYAESSALAEGVEGAKNCTEAIVNPDAQDGTNGWEIVKGEGSGGNISILSNEPFTDAADVAEHNYFDGGNWGAQAWDVTFKQDVTLAAGKYQLTVIARAEKAVDMSLYAGADSVKTTCISSAGGLFNRGWNDTSLEFEMEQDGTIEIGVRGVTEAVHNWMSFTRFRLVQLSGNGEVEPVEPIDPDLVEIPQSQSPEVQDGANRADVVEGDGYTQYTTKADISVIIKMLDIDVKDCDYVVVKFAEPVPSGIKIAFWNGNDNVEIPEGDTEYKYVFATDPKCAIANDVLPQICVLTLWNAGKVVKISGVYKHKVAQGEEPVEPAEGVYYSWESPEGTAIETGGTIAYVNGDGDRLNYKNGNYYTICLNGKKAKLNEETASADAGRMVITLDKAVAAGDTIAITGYITKKTSAKSSAYVVFENGTAVESEVFGDDANIYSGEDKEFTGTGAITTKNVIVPAEAAGSTTITLTRGQTGTNLFITKLQIIEYKIADAINSIAADRRLDGTIYNLNGQKVNKAQKGLYIINGKKVMIK